MGKSSKPTIGYRHYMGLYMGESRTSDYLSAVEIGGEMAWEGTLSGSGSIDIDKPMLFGGDKKEGGIVGTLKVRQGAADQLPDPYMVAQVPGPWPAARGLCTTVFDGQVGAMNPYLKLWKKRWGAFTAGWTTPVWHPELCKIDRGKNPMHIIYQTLTDKVSGLGFDPAIIDESSFLAAAQTLFDEGFGLCLPFRRADPAGNFIQVVCDHVAGQWAFDPRLGKITFTLFRADYDVDALPVLDESNIVKMESFQQVALDNSSNEITVVGRDAVTNKDISVTYQNLANVQAQGRVVNEKKQYPGLWNRDLCARVAARDAAVASSLLARIKVIVKADLWGIKRGDVYALSWARKGWAKVPVRVLEVDEGTRTDSKIGLVLAQDVTGMVDATYIVPTDTQWTPPDDEPAALPAQRVYEASYRDLAGAMGPADLAALAEDAGYLVALGARPTAVAAGYDLRTRTGSDPFKDVGAGDFSPTGLLAADISMTETLIALTNATDLSLVEVGSEAMIGNETVRVDAIDADAGTATIARGCVDTVPQAHTTGDRVWFTDTYVGADPTEYIDGETVDAKLLCRTRKGTLDESLATTVSLAIDQRQARPYPPGKLRLNASVAPPTITGALTVTWAHRDRVLQADQLVDTEAASVGPALDTRYGLRFLDASDALLVERLDIAGATADVALAYTGTVNMELYAINNVGDSWQKHVRTFSYTPPPGTSVSVITAATYQPTDYVLDGGGA